MYRTLLDFSSVSVSASTTTIRGAGGTSIDFHFDGIYLKDWEHVQFAFSSTPDVVCTGHSEVVMVGSYQGANTIFLRTNNLIHTKLCSPGVADLRIALDGSSFEETSLRFNLTNAGIYQVLFVYLSAIDDFG